MVRKIISDHEHGAVYIHGIDIRHYKNFHPYTILHKKFVGIGTQSDSVLVMNFVNLTDEDLNRTASFIYEAKKQHTISFHENNDEESFIRLTLTSKSIIIGIIEDKEGYTELTIKYSEDVVIDDSWQPASPIYSEYESFIAQGDSFCYVKPKAIFKNGDWLVLIEDSERIPLYTLRLFPIPKYYLKNAITIETLPEVTESNFLEDAVSVETFFHLALTDSAPLNRIFSNLQKKRS